MQIVYLSNADLPSRRANSVHIMKMCAALAANGHGVRLMAPWNTDPMWRENRFVFDFYGVPKAFSIERLWRPKSTLGDYVYAMLSLIATRRAKPDLVFSRYLLGSIVTSVTGIASGVELHQPLPDRSRLQKSLFHSYISRPSFRCLVVITEPLKKIFMERFGVPERQILIAPDGADLPRAGARVWGRITARLQIGYVGHLYRGRGVELIVDLAAGCPWADFHIIGGTETDIARVKSLAISTPNLSIHGFVSPATAEEMRLGMDVLLAPYQDVVALGSGDLTTERWMSPLKVFEYMAAGKAIVCSDVPILREVLHHEENCILCGPNRLPEWVAALEKLRDNDTLRAQLGRTALEDVTEKYLWKTRAERIVDAIAMTSRA